MHWTFCRAWWVTTYASLVFFSLLTKQFFGDCIIFTPQVFLLFFFPQHTGGLWGLWVRSHTEFCSHQLSHLPISTAVLVCPIHIRKTAPVCPTQHPEPLQLHTQPCFPWTSRPERASSLVYHKPLVNKHKHRRMFRWALSILNEKLNDCYF